MAGKTMKIALIGCGGLGSRHAKNINSLEGAELVAICDANIDSARKLAGELSSSPTPYGDHQKLLSDQEPDVVFVITPNHTHCELAVSAAKAGAHVFCEKPMALTVEDCDAMISAAESAGVYLTVGYVRRFQNAYREMKRLIDDGKIGDVQMAHAVRLGSGAPGGAGGWQLSRDAYGGLFSMHSHELDQLTWMAGEVKAVQAVMKHGDGSENTVEESIFINLQFASGAIGSLSSSRIYPANSYELGLAGTEGALKITSGGGTDILFQKKGEKPETFTFERNDALLEELSSFLNCIREQRPPEPNGYDGKRTIAISLAAHESARTGNLIEIPVL